jgi:hypothetical protein
MDPMSGGPAHATGQPEQVEGGGGGACASCGRELPPPDLEAVAASIDQMLSLEAGKIVPRTAWAGRPPDGVMDALMFWLPSVKANRRLWERGQSLWTEQMTAALSGPCADCHGAMAPPPPAAPAPTLVQMPEEAPAPPAPTAYLPYEPNESGSAGAPSVPSTGRLSAAEASGEAMTSAVPAYSDYNNIPATPVAHPGPVEDAPTSATPSFAGGFGGAAPSDRLPEQPVPESDEHESHTVMLSALPSLRVTTRLVVLEGPVRGRQFSLGRDRTTIGRSIGCHVTVEADDVEYDHARVVRAGDGWQIELAGSATDLFVNEEPVRGSRVLRPGDIIRIGPAQLRFESAS